MCGMDGPTHLQTYILRVQVREYMKKMFRRAGCQWFTPVILATQEAEIRRITI
jgi:hypothetical protein